jgi:hypothetical protein
MDVGEIPSRVMIKAAFSAVSKVIHNTIPTKGE